MVLPRRPQTTRDTDELMARSGLLPRVTPADRELARMQMVASGAAYQAGVTSLPAPQPISLFP